MDKSQIEIWIRENIVALLYKVLSMKSAYPDLNLLKISSNYEYLNAKRRWYYGDNRDWKDELSEFVQDRRSKNTFGMFFDKRDVSKFFNLHLTEPTLAAIMGMSGIKNPFDILAIFKYGSRVYGCATEKSDFDYILIKKSGPREEKTIERRLVNINIISQEDFVSDLDNHEISALECWCLPDKYILRDELDTMAFSLNKAKLRHSISEKASHSFVKAKKKFTVPEDKNIYVGKKSLFHSLRIIDFGTQLAKLGKIQYYDSSNYLYKEIMNNPSEDWEDYKKIYKPLYNSLMTNFRLLAPKE